MIRNYLQFYPRLQKWAEKWPDLDAPLDKLGMPSMVSTCDDWVTFYWTYSDQCGGRERRESYYLKAGPGYCSYKWASFIEDPNLGTFLGVDSDRCDRSEWFCRVLMCRALWTKKSPSKFTLFKVIGAL